MARYASGLNWPLTWKPGSLPIAARIARIGHREAEIGVRLLQEGLADHAVEHALLQFGLFEIGSRERRARILRGLLAQFVETLLPVLLGDLVIANLRDVCVDARDEVRLDAEERDGENADTENDGGGPAMDLVTQGLQHDATREGCADNSLPAVDKAKAPRGRLCGPMAEWTGLEPATSGVTGQHSNRLNYHSTFRMVGAEGIEPPTSAV